VHKSILTLQQRQPVDLIIDVACDRPHARVFQALAALQPAIYDIDRLVQSSEIGRLVNASLIILAAHTLRGESSDGLAARIRASFPSVSIFVCTRREDSVHLRLCEFARAGVDDLFCLDSESDLTALLDEARLRLAAPHPTAVLTEAATTNPSDGQAIALWCLRNTYRKRTVAALATWFEIDPKTANRHCAESGFVNASALLRSGRLYHFQEIRRRMRCTAAAAAAAGLRGRKSA
jgi:hypothetical protein